MKTLNLIAAILLLIGGLVWGLVGFFGVNPINSIFAQSPGIARLIYALVGLSALIQIFQWKKLQKFWK
jgi:uncharacterized membrane protein YuzA (DUF378 family)